jgi:pilus assembly protein Flp/PilA
MTAFLQRLWSDESGATMVEYGLMIALIAVVCIGAVRVLGTNTQGSFNASANAMGAMTQQSCASSGGTYTAANPNANPPTGATCTYPGQ